MLQKKYFLAASLGNALEYYDVTLYGFFASLLAPLYFPSSDPTLSLMASFATFAVGFIVRPLGGAAFGYVGDRFGRKVSLSFSIGIVILPTLTMGILPTYDQIGVLAPVILVLCRLLQGLCVGGEYPSASVFIIEHTLDGKKGWAGSLLTTSGVIGALFGSAFGALCTLPQMPSWGWRIPFLVGAGIGIVIIRLRFLLLETSVFENSSGAITHRKSPFKEIILNFKRNFLSVVCIGSATVTPLYLITTYLGSLKNQAGTPHFLILLSNSLYLISVIICMPLMGKLSDKIGTTKVMLLGSLGIFLWSYPFFIFMETASLTSFVFAQAIIALFNSAFVGPAPSFETTLFPPQVRCTAIGLAYGIGGAILGGTTPLICSVLVKTTGDIRTPAFYIMFTAFLGALGVLYGKRMNKTHLLKT